MVNEFMAVKYNPSLTLSNKVMIWSSTLFDKVHILTFLLWLPYITLVEKWRKFKKQILHFVQSKWRTRLGQNKMTSLHSPDVTNFETIKHFHNLIDFFHKQLFLKMQNHTVLSLSKFSRGGVSHITIYSNIEKAQSSSY